MNYVEICRFSPISNRLLKLVIALLNYPLAVTDMWTEMAEEKAKLVFFLPKGGTQLILVRLSIVETFL